MASYKSNYQSSRNREVGATTSYHYIKLTWKKIVFHNGIYSNLEYSGGYSYVRIT